MEAILRSTTRVVQAGAIRGRVWEGETDTGIPIVCLITKVDTLDPDDRGKVKAELDNHDTPSDSAAQAFCQRVPA